MQFIKSSRLYARLSKFSQGVLQQEPKGTLAFKIPRSSNSDFKRYIVYGCPKQPTIGTLHVHLSEAPFVKVVATFDLSEELDDYLETHGGHCAHYSAMRDVYVKVGGQSSQRKHESS